MVIKKLTDLENLPVTGEGVDKVTRRVVLGAEDGAPNFTMRCFTVAPGGFTFYHTHDYEHELFILSGSGVARGVNSEVSIERDEAILVMPNEWHQFINNGQEPLVFLCIIPNQPQ